MVESLYIFALVAFYIMLRYFIFFMMQKFKIKKNDLALICIKDLLFEWIIVSILFICLFFLFFLLTSWNGSAILLILIAIINGSIFISYGFIVQPILDAFSKSKFQESKKYENWIKLNFNYSIKVQIMEKDIFNAYATGVVPFSKFILLGRSIIQNMNEDDVKGLLAHELGHTKKNHLFILYFINILCCSLLVVSSSYFIPKFNKLDYTAFWVALHGGFWGGILVLIPGLCQRKVEKSADLFAANAIGLDNYIGVLTKLDILTNGGLSKKSINYPTLIQRIIHIKKHGSQKIHI